MVKKISEESVDSDEDIPDEVLLDEPIDDDDDDLLPLGQSEPPELVAPPAPLSSEPPLPSTVVPVTEQSEQSLPVEDTALTLEPEILQMLGEDPADEKSYGDNLHKDIASRWSHILTNGLTKDIQSDLVKQYLPPENCPNMKAPKPNLEIKAALTEINIKKDLYSQSKQNQLASSLAAIGQVLNWAIKSKTVPQDIIKKLSDAGRLVCDSHYRESLSRRFAVLNTLNKSTRDTVKDTKIDENLFGANLSEHLRSSKAISKTGAELKPTPRPPYKAPANPHLQRGALNSRGTPRAATAEPRQAPAPRRPPPSPRDRRQDAQRGRRSSGYTRH